MREVAVIDTRDTKHSNDVEQDAHSKRCPAKADPDYTEASQVNGPEKKLLN
jgi:hypothetical protein